MTKDDRLKVLLVDDDPQMLEVLKALLAEKEDVTVVGEALDGPEGIDLAVSLMPDILVTDYIMPGMTGMEVAIKLRPLCPLLKVIALSIREGAIYVARMLEAGALGYVGKNNVAEELPDAIDVVKDGGVYISPHLVGPLLKEFHERVAPKAPFTSTKLMQRELSVLKGLANGQSLKDIADEMNVSRLVAEDYQKSVMKRLGCKSTKELSAYAENAGLIDNE